MIRHCCLMAGMEFEKPEVTLCLKIWCLYELHVRDFSILDESVTGRSPRHVRRIHLSFVGWDEASAKALARAGLTHIHILPAFDIATINEDKTSWRSPDSGRSICNARRIRKSSRRWSMKSGQQTASIGAMTRFITLCRRGAILPIQMAVHADPGIPRDGDGIERDRVCGW